MDVVSLLVGLLVGLVVGIGLFVLLGQASRKALEGRAEDAAERERRATAELETQRQELKGLQQRLEEGTASVAGLRSTLEERDRAHAERLAAYEDAEAKLKDAFQALSANALKVSNEQFVQTAEQVLKQYTNSAQGDLEKRQKGIEDMLQPFRERLQEMQEHNRQLEQRRGTAYTELQEQVRAMLEQQDSLRRETSLLSRALQDPGSAGQWGEMVLERVVEMAGLTERFDWEQQATIADGDGGRQRPDLFVHLPGGRLIIVDSKAPMKQYLDGLETADATAREALFKAHATKVVEHAKGLRKRNYSGKLAEALDFVVMFLPSEAAFRTALEARPSAIEEAMENNVVIATPTTLLALLRAVAYGWRQERLATNALQLQEDATELYKRLCTMAGHIERLGKAVGNIGEHYNKFVSSLETRVLPQARKFRDHGVQGSEELSVIEPAEVSVRPLTSPDFAPSLPETD